MNASQAYALHCRKLKVKPNSELTMILKNSSTLTELNLSNNYLGTEGGFECFLEVLRAAPNLQTLDLSQTCLMTENVKALCEVLTHHPGITALKLRDNRLYIDSAKELIRLVRLNKNISLVDVAATASPFSNKIPEKLLHQLTRDTLSNNCIDKNL